MKTKWLAALAAVLALSVMGCKDEPESVEVESVTLSETALTLAPGETGKLAATVTPGDADNRTVTWKSSDPAVATVGKDGTVTAHEEGTATVTARAGGKTAECAVTVKRMLIAVEQVTLDKATLTLIRGETGTLTATVTPDDADDRTVAWSSSNDEVATVGSDGTVTAVGKGTATVTAQAGGKEAACEVTVSVAVERVTLSTGTLTIEPGKTRTLTATVTPGDADDRTVTWKSSDETVATVGDDGTVTAHGEGTATITATTRDGGKTAECAVTVRRILIAVERVTLDKATLTLTRGETGTLAATVTPENADDRTVAWSSSAPAVATVDKDGTVTAVKAGEATITAQAGDMTAECKVTVNPVLVTGVALGETTLALTRGEKVKLAATVTPDNADDRTVAWKSSDETIATVGTDGTITAVKVGTATVTATTRDGGFTAECKVTVNPILVNNVTLDITTLTLAPNMTKTLTAKVEPDDADDTTVTWSSSDPAVATVGDDGTVTATKRGTATITVTTRDGGKTATCAVTVHTDHSYANGICTSCGFPKPSLPDGTIGVNGVLTKYSGNEANLSIPKGVTGIGYEAFLNNKTLTSVTIPDGVTSIGNRAFYNCTSLASVTIGDGVTSIGRNSEFDNCTGLTSVTIPASVTSIDFTFNCLREVRYEGELAQWCGIDREDSSTNPLLFNAVLYIGGKELTEADIPDGVTEIKAYAFYEYSHLTSVTIPASVTSIGSYAFKGCSGLGTVTYKGTLAQWCGIDWKNSDANPLSNGKAVLYIGGKELTEADIPDGVTEIKAYAFLNCTGLTSVTIPASVTSIGGSAFSGCSGLGTVTYKGTLVQWCAMNKDSSLGDNAKHIILSDVADLKELNSLVIPEGMTSIGGGSFSGCSGLTSVTIPEGVTSIGNSAFYGCYGLTSVTIPDGVTSIGWNAFDTCSSLTSVTIGEGVTIIGFYAFQRCSKLTNVHYNGTEEEWRKIFIGFASGLSGKTITGKDGTTWTAQ